MCDRSFSVSVAMAAYNGSNYIGEQIKTILPQLKEEDELIISLDPSSDDTERIIQEISKTDRRIKLIHGKGQGLVRNFDNAIKHCKNDIIFLSDQDDLWNINKVDCVLKAFQNPAVNVVVHDAMVINEKKECMYTSFFNIRGCGKGIIKNIVKNSYIGCCMAFRKDIKKYILPFPVNIPMHDQWIGLIGEITGRNMFVQKTLISYRRHKDNASAETHSDFRQMLMWRLTLVVNLLKFVTKYYMYKERKRK